jgi:hypothetical protein
MAQFELIRRKSEKARVHKPLGNSVVLARHLIMSILAVPA